MRHLILIDASNLRGAIVRHYGADFVLDFEAFEKFVKGRVGLGEEDEFRFMAYLVSPESGPDGIVSLAGAMMARGWCVRLKTLKHVSESRYRNTDWDAGLSVDALRAAWRGEIDSVTVFSGDGDLVDVLRALREDFHLRAVVIGFPGEVSYLLHGEVDEVMFVEDGLFRRRERAELESALLPEEKQVVEAARREFESMR